jgi:EAL domain-containing protein (putative c-di-GMP-specific phosphodiesterase class I)
MDRRELRLEYQPVVASVDGNITGVEALLRWQHPSRGLVPPTTLIPIAEQSGLIAEIGRWVLARVWTDRHSWQSHCRDPNLGMSVNVSAHELESATFAANLAKVLSTAEADLHLLTLEVAEGAFARDSDHTLGVLNDLKDIGVMLAIDGFGAGHSSLSYLKQFPIDTVKIDQLFVVDLEQDLANRAIVEAMVRLAHGLGMTVVAQGVETTEQHREVTRLGCDFCQGFYFARPMSTASVTGVTP